MAKNLCMVLWGTGQCYELHSSASISVHSYSTSVTVLGILKEEKKELVQNSILLFSSGHALVCCLATYFYV